MKNDFGGCSVEVHVKYVTKVLHLAVKYDSERAESETLLYFKF